MQIKIFSIPLLGGEAVNEEMNVFMFPSKFPKFTLGKNKTSCPIPPKGLI